MQLVHIQYTYKIKPQTTINSFTYITQVRHGSARIDGTLAKKPDRYKYEHRPERQEGVEVQALSRALQVAVQQMDGDDGSSPMWWSPTSSWDKD